MRPLPIQPRGPRRARPRRAQILLACPRLSPAWEFDAVHALMKPNERTKGRIEHAAAQQAWPGGADAIVGQTLAETADRLGFRPEAHRPEAGDYHLAIPCPSAQLEEAKALAVLLSRRLPDLWFTLGRLLAHDGRFLRRARGYKLRLIPATNVHLRRDIRAQLKGLL